MSDLVSKLSVRRLAPLAAVLALAGPGAALAAGPAPDAAPNSSELAPDPVPATHATPRTTAAAPRSRPMSTQPAPRKPVTSVPRTRYVHVYVPAPAVSTQPVQQPRATTPPVHRPKPTPAKRVLHAKKAKAHKDPPIPIVDVVPLRVDLHPTLGAIASNVRNDGQLVLAAAALLAAVAAAASGAALAFVGRRPA